MARATNAREAVGNHRRQLSKAGLVGAASQRLIRQGRTIWIVDAHRGDGKRFIVHADEILTAFVELERAMHAFAVSLIS